jgi:uncharacterized PurR-regulated membrane protein YhhQ (DUF165 family)
MKWLSKVLKQCPRWCPATLSYIGCIVLINTLFLQMPVVTLFGFTVTTADFTVGILLVVRDFAQRELQHSILFAMLIGSVLSYFFATPGIAIASFSAFVVAEMTDWSIFTFTQKPLSKRLIWSSVISSPMDSFVFAWLMHMHFPDFALMTLAKIIGVMLMWFFWKYPGKQFYQSPVPILAATDTDERVAS